MVKAVTIPSLAAKVLKHRLPLHTYTVHLRSPTVSNKALYLRHLLTLVSQVCLDISMFLCPNILQFSNLHLAGRLTRVSLICTLLQQFMEVLPCHMFMHLRSKIHSILPI